MFAHNYEGIDNLTYADSIRSWMNYKETWGEYESVMNYFNLYKYNTIMDYSDGSNGGPYDRNDWIHINMVNFQTESRVVADSTYESPGKDLIINETINFNYTGWKYDENLTIDYRKHISDWSPIDPIQVDWRVYQKITHYRLNSIFGCCLKKLTYQSTVLRVPSSRSTSGRQPVISIIFSDDKY